MTVILSMNMDSTAAMIVNVIKIGTVLHFTRKAIFMHNQRKKPERAMPSTISIMPAMNRIVAQLMPALSLSST